jgi:hypothetical protein
MSQEEAYIIVARGAHHREDTAAEVAAVEVILILFVNDTNQLCIFS